MKTIKTRLLFLLSLIICSQAVADITWTKENNIRVNYIPCAVNEAVRGHSVLIQVDYHQNVTGGDDETQYFEIFIENPDGTFSKFFELDDNHNLSNDWNANGQDYSYSFSQTSGINAQFGLSDANDGSGDQLYTFIIRLYNFSQGRNDLGQAKFRFQGINSFEGGQVFGTQDASAYFDQADFIEISAGSANLTASGDDCDKITLNWSYPSITPSCVYDDQFGGVQFQTVIYDQQDQEIGIQPYSENSFEIPPQFNPEPGIEKSFYIRFRKDQAELGTSYIWSGPSSSATGLIKPTPNPPNNLQVSDDICDSEIELQWDGPGFQDVFPDQYFIFYSEPGNTTADTAEIAGTSTSYTFEEITRGIDYTFRISSTNECGIGQKTDSIVGISPLDPTAPTNVLAIPSPETNSIEITWTESQNQTGYTIERIPIPTSQGAVYDFDAGLTEVSYTDENVPNCQSYLYRVLAKNQCVQGGIPSDSSSTTALIPDLSNSFNEESLLGSKGFFPNRVVLGWTADTDEVLEFNIFRRQLGSAQDSIQIGTTSQFTYTDDFTDAGILYEYFVVGTRYCDVTLISTNVATDIGFRSPFGTVTGNVSYTGGIAVEGVKISTESTSQINGQSLEFSGDDSLRIENSSTLNFEDGLLFETWLRPEVPIGDLTLASFEGVFRVAYDSGNQTFVFETFHGANGSSTLIGDASDLSFSNFRHVAFQFGNDSLYYFLNGNKQNAVLAVQSTLETSSSPIVIGNGYSGMLDEVRVWNTWKSDLEMSQDFSRIMLGGEDGLKGCYRLNEGAGRTAYDISKNQTVFNNNHAEFIGTPEWSTEIPTGSQLSIAAYTDENGNYAMSVPYNGLGEGFVLTPSFLIHQFDPGTRGLFVGDGQTIQNNIDFEDISSFNVTGSVFYQNTTCPAEGVNLLVDGNIVVSDGLPVETASDGTFSIQVPIGEHHISVSKPGHVFSVGRFPEEGKFDFQDDLAFSSPSFVDSTLVKVVGRVVGGLREANKLPGLGLSKNNIGQARIEFVSQLADGCAGDTVFTDLETGEYSTFLPPLKYTPSVSIVNNPTIDFGVLDLLDYTTTPQAFSAYDSTFTTDGQVDNIDSVFYNFRLDYIHRVNPIVVVKDRDGVNDFIGDSIYTYINPNTNDTIIRNLRTDPFRWPIFTRQDDDYLYRALIKVFERYVNADNSALIDSVPSTDGVLTINNTMADVESAQIELLEVNTPDSLKFLIYSFKADKPNFLANGAIPAYSYTSFIEMNVVTSSGNTIWWEPAEALEGGGGDQLFRAVYLGEKTDGAQFVTAGPAVPEYVLRDPPGSGSSASREVGSIKSDEASWGWNLDTKAHMEDAFFLGAKFMLGLGVSTLTENELNTTAGFSATISGGNSGTQSIATTNTQSWSTNSEGGTPGSGSDLYVGKSKNIQFGVSEHLSIVPDSLCDQVECLGASATGFQYARRYSLSIVPGGYNTTFIYNQDNILNEQIPNLIDLRNTLLQSNDKYSSTLDISNPNYGLNNDDPVFGGNVSTDNPRQADFADLSGPSYSYAAVDLLDSLTGDSVRFFNDQIYQWQDAIRLNEWEKLNIDNIQVRDSLRQKELDDLEEKNSDMLTAYDILIVANGIGGLGVAYGLIANPVPGASFAGYAVFAITTGTGIAQAELAEEFERYQQAKDRIEEKFEGIVPANYSISGGNSFSSSMTHETATSYTRSVNYNMDASMKFELENKVSNNGVGYEKGIEMSFTSSRDWTEASGESESVSFTLEDPDQTDFFSVDVYPSLLGWGPIFKKQPGGQTSCPYEDEEVSLFEEPGSILSNATLQVDKPSLTVSPSILTNVPVTESAVFNLTLGNESESDDEREYQVRLVSLSNPFGAIATIDGESSALVSVPAGSSVNKVLSIEKGPGAVYEYDSLLFVITAPCEGFNLSDSIYVSARFIPTCTDVELVVPEEAWVANTFNNDTIVSVIAGYDINFFAFEELKLEYKPSNESQWIGLETFYRDTTGLNDPDAIPIPTDFSFTLYDWEVNQLVDGFYDLRTRSVCTLADNTSVTYSGILDRILPEVFGSPSPADGILSPNDDIGITFNEDIDMGALTQLNFDVRGVLNGTETLHSTSLFFDGVDDFMEIQAGAPLKNRDFTIQLAIRRAGTGAETILAQGQDEGEEIFLGFNNADQLVFGINGEFITSTETFANDLWHYIGVSYSFENETADMYIANGTTSGVINIGDNAIFSNYEGSDRMIIGRRDHGTPGYFNGNIHELRIWDRALSFNEFNLTMNRILSKTEAGLLYNWRMDELEGIIAEDHVRRRDAVITGAQWAVEPGGSSASFDGVSNYVNVSTGDVLITDDMNFTMEMWFRGSGSEEETLFSNGSGNGALSDSLFSWNLTKSGDGSMAFTNNGNSFNVTDNNYFDGEWHHLAIVLDRNSNITSVIDGNIENSVPSTPFRQLTGASMTLGAWVYQSETSLVETNFFSGQLDEFRFWNTNRTVEQVNRDRKNRMRADEPGLLVYMPFENYDIDPTGIPILTPSFEEQIDGELHVVTENGTSLSEESPLIRIERPVNAIAFTYAVNGDQIIITPTSSSAQIENVTLDVTVSNVRDLQGNIMASPVTWIAFVDKNQVVWGDDQLAFEKPVGDELAFTSQIVNQGGAEKAFNVQNIPSWLSVSPSLGSVLPNSSIEVEFEVDPLINIGDYTQDIQLLTDFNFPERLTIELKVRETPPDFDFEASDYQLSMGFIGLLEIRGITSTDEEDILIAEVDGEVRGVQQLTYLEDVDRYLAYLNVYSDEPFGEEIDFKIWDASAGVLYSEVSPDDIVFEANQLIGSPLLPQLFSTDFEIEAEIPLAAGWNWFGHYLQNPDSTNFDALFESLSSLSGDQINGQDQFSNYTPSSGWVGPLENTGIRAEEGYKFFLNEADTLLLQGDIIDPSSRLISLDQGWNWIGFVSIRNQSIDQALGNLNPSDGDQIKGRSSFSIYVNTALGWQGTLNTLVPGESYMYQSAENTIFSYPFAGFFKGNTADPTEVSHKIWQVDYGAFASNMNVILTVTDSCEMPKSMLLGAFDKEGIIRGLSEYDADLEPRGYLTINGENGMRMDLHPIDPETGEKYASLGSFDFESNELKGDYFNPVAFDANGLFCENSNNTNASALHVFPTVFDSDITLNYNSLGEDENARIIIYDLNGRVVRNQNVGLVEGSNQFKLDLSNEDLVSGPYLLRLESKHGSESVKLIKINL